MGIAQFTSSKFVISQSIAEFKSNIGVTGNVIMQNPLTGSFVGDGSALSGITEGGGIKLFVGSSSGNPPTFDEWITGSGGVHNITLNTSASSGYLNHYTFIRQKSDGVWNVVSSGSQNGLQERNYYEAVGLDTGIYRYLVLGHSSASKATIVKGTTITINPELL
tara:strand:- start:3357 stop:3848 length:492 start_codon:yes stop_codon:yes gene_type:complete